MAVVFEEALKKDISAKNAMGTYILFGDDSYLKEMYLGKLSKTAASSDDVFNFRKFSSKCDLQEVYDFAVQFPMMADKKCAIIKDFDISKMDSNEFERLLKIAEEDFETTLIIFVFDFVEFDYKKGDRAKKLIKAAEKSGGKAVCLNHRGTAELAKMLCDGAAKRGCKIERSTAFYLIELVGEEILVLVNELEKLCNFAPKSVINKETVDKVSVKSPEATVYNLTDKIFALKTDEAIKIVDELFFSRIEPFIILYTISSCFIDMYRLFAAKRNGFRKTDVAEKFEYKNRSFVLDKAERYLSKLNEKKLLLCLDAIKTAEESLKSFRSDERLAIEQLVIRLIYIIAKGEAVD